MTYTTTVTDPAWHDVATLGVAFLLVLSLITIAAGVVTEVRRRRQARSDDPLGIARSLGVLRDHTARLGAKGARR